jgi:hypothetical protein
MAVHFLRTGVPLTLFRIEPAAWLRVGRFVWWFVLFQTESDAVYLSDFVGAMVYIASGNGWHEINRVGL